jgi:hypothetical protein
MAELSPPTGERQRALSLGHRFVCAYLVVYHALFGLPVVGWLSARLGDAEGIALMWLARVLGIDADPNGGGGSGDTTLAYIGLILVAGLAVAATAVWRLLRTPARDARLDAIARVYLRYVLAYTLLSYGLIKILMMQMPAPGPTRLSVRVGDMAPMALLWTFIGASAPYEMFCGAAETLAGLLLLGRRTASLGALVACAAMGNVVMLNLCYDVPVKQYSMHLLLTAGFLLWPDLGRLLRAALGHAVPARVSDGPSPRWHLIVKLLVVAYVGVWDLGHDIRERYYAYGPGAPRSPLYGSYRVETMLRDGKPELAWSNLYFEQRYFVVLDTDGARQRMAFEYDAESRTLAAYGAVGGVMATTFPDTTHVALGGVLGDHLVEVRLVRLEDKSWPLTSRGFHWINERPRNL